MFPTILAPNKKFSMDIIKPHMAVPEPLRSDAGDFLLESDALLPILVHNASPIWRNRICKARNGRRTYSDFRTDVFGFNRLIVFQGRFHMNFCNPSGDRGEAGINYCEAPINRR